MSPKSHKNDSKAEEKCLVVRFKQLHSFSLSK